MRHPLAKSIAQHNENTLVLQCNATAEKDMAQRLNVLIATTGIEDIPLCFKNFTISPSKAERGTSLVTFTCIDTIPHVLAELVSMDIISESMGKQIYPSFNMPTSEVINNSFNM